MQGIEMLRDFYRKPPCEQAQWWLQELREGNSVIPRAASDALALHLAHCPQCEAAVFPGCWYKGGRICSSSKSRTGLSCGVAESLRCLPCRSRDREHNQFCFQTADIALGMWPGREGGRCGGLHDIYHLLRLGVQGDDGSSSAPGQGRKRTRNG